MLVSLLPPTLDRDWVVVGLARGGIPIAAAIARALGAPLDVLILRKVGVPGNPELALAAVTGPGPDQMVVNETVRRLHRISPDQLAALSAPAVAEVKRRRSLWLHGAAQMDLHRRRVLLVDDGMATGTTMLAAIRVMRQLGVAQIAVAIPVALGQSLKVLPADIAPILCPDPANPAPGVGAAYDSFPQIEDQEVVDLIAPQATTPPPDPDRSQVPDMHSKRGAAHATLAPTPRTEQSTNQHAPPANPRGR